MAMLAFNESEHNDLNLISSRLCKATRLRCRYFAGVVSPKHTRELDVHSGTRDVHTKFPDAIQMVDGSACSKSSQHV